jgi:UDP-N-acetylglucosamine 2-epimerase
MGEDPSRVYNYGCPSMDVLCNENLEINNEIMAKYGGVGISIDWKKPYVLMIQHPVTTEYGKGREDVEKSLEALLRIPNIQKVVLWPNIDAGSDDVSKGIRMFRERHPDAPFGYYKNFSPEDYGRVLYNSLCCVGNSSSFVRENAFLGVPSVLVGSRQEGREHSSNAVYVDYDEDQIYTETMKQIGHGKYAPDYLYGRGDAGVQIAEKIANLELSLKKSQSYEVQNM